MPLNLDAWLTAHGGLAVLVFARSAGLVWTAPALGTAGLDARSRIVLAALLGLVLVPAVVGVDGTTVELGLTACLAEAIVGAALGWSAALIVAGARQAGEIVGAQAGFSASALFDPEAGDDLTALGHLYGLVALAVFLALDGPLTLVHALVESYRAIPAGGAVLSEESARMAFERVGEGLALSLRAAAPAAVALAVAGVALGLLGRAAPSLPLIALSIPARAALGLMLVFISLATLAVTLAAAWGDWPGLLPGGISGAGGG